MALPKDLVAASTTPLILSILNIEESYGYAIIQKVKLLSNDQMEWADGMLYPILHRLEKKGWIESFWGVAETGRKRKYYRISANGKKELNIQRKNWLQLTEMLNLLQHEGE